LGIFDAFFGKDTQEQEQEEWIQMRGLVSGILFQQISEQRLFGDE